MDQIVNTPRLVLRPMTMVDLAGCHAIWSDPLVGKWMIDGTSPTLEASQLKLSKILTPPAEVLQSLPDEVKAKLPYSEPLSIYYAVYLPKGSAAQEEQIGMICYNLLYHPTYDIFRPYNLSYNFKSSAWGKGYASEAVKSFMIALPKELRENALAVVLGKNARSRKLMENTGFVESEREYVPGIDEDGGDLELILYRWKK
ncbi:hypothetical protein BT69DRAFT_211003 [Atractiella rhizophila]|nr:hypothetical protein BT69DRAFT_225023 [Atractiella rhizophila]KAH8922773.1 hypothetical protein BT69DRAFT_211003 [Atractiella rhizophila]